MFPTLHHLHWPHQLWIQKDLEEGALCLAHPHYHTSSTLEEEKLQTRKQDGQPPKAGTPLTMPQGQSTTPALPHLPPCWA